MKLQSKIFIPVIISLTILGGSMYLLNRQILKEVFNSEMQKVLTSKEKNFNELLQSKLEYLSQFSNALANSYAIRSAFVVYDQTNNNDSAWNIINSEIDRIKFGGVQQQIQIPPINCHVPPGIVLFRSRSQKYGDNVIHKRRAIQKAFDEKKSVSGLEIGSYGIDLRGISPVNIKNKFYGTVEVNLPISDIIEELKPEEYESYALIVDKTYNNVMNKVDAMNDASNFINDNVIMIKTEGFELSDFKPLFEGEIIQSQKIDMIEQYNYMQIPIKSFNNEVIGTLVYQVSKADFIENMNASSYSLFFIGIMIFIIAIVVLFLVLKTSIINPLKRVTNALSELSKGIVTKAFLVKSKDEIGEMQTALNVVNLGIQKMSDFAVEIGNGEYQTEFTALSEKDQLGNTLIQVRDKLKDVFEQEQHQSSIEKQRKWAVEGHSKFAAILQDNEMEIKEYTYNILSNLIKYLNVNQGALFLLSSDKETLVLESAYAYDRRKHMQSEIKLGDGLLGSTALEGKVTFLTDLPKDYITITSGLGDATPNSLLIVPLISNNELYGVFEIASFKKLEAFEVEFCENIAENIAQAIARQQSAQQTRELLEQSRQQAEELSAQEEEMRQNLEEMQATQEEMARKEAELTGVINALNSSAIVVEFNLNAEIIKVNKRAIEVLKLNSEKDIIGKNHQDFYVSDNYEEEAAMLWDDLSQDKTVNRVAQVQLMNGETMWLNETYSPVLDESGQIDRIMNISFDVTEQVLKEQQVVQQNEEIMAKEEEMRQNLEEMFATQEEMARKEAEINGLLRAVDKVALLVDFDVEGNIIDVNDQVLELLQLNKKDDVIGMHHSQFYQFANYEMAAEQLFEKLKNNEIVSFDTELNTPDGRTVKLNETYAPILNENDEVIKVINISFRYL
ncbi:MAG: PAS domain-containing protein [Bacteroidales bacterium]|nr:PAS domain-containing protein [Bacteroidales bacterium]